MKLHKKQTLSYSLGLLGLIFSSTPMASAALVASFTTEAVFGNPHVGTIAATTGDLLETVGSIASSQQTKPNGNDTHLTSGSIETGTGSPDDVFKGGDDSAAAFIEYDLDTTVNTLGYDITSLQTFTFWTDNRAGQAWKVQFRPVGGSFSDFYTLAAQSANNEVTKVDLSDGGAVIASGIDGIRFDFIDAPANWQGYREIDVIGSASAVPEPSSTALFGLGGLALILRRRK